jgi:hypothetical protein
VINSERPAHVAITNLIHRYAEPVDAADFDGPGKQLRPIFFCRYFDTFACTDGVWRFASRRYVEPAAGDASEHLLQPLATRH